MLKRPHKTLDFCNRGYAVRLKQNGVSMIELILFIVIISIALAGILLVMNTVTGRSADSLIRKQALAIGESLLEEIQLQGVAGVNPAVGSANADRTTFDNVFNYAGYNTTAGIQNMDTTAVAGLGGYKVTPPVVVAGAVLGGIAAGNAVVITVSVTDPQGNTVAVTGYRAAP